MKFLTKSEFAKRIEQLKQGRAYMTAPGSAMDFPPGYLSIIENLLRDIDAFSGGTIDFLWIGQKAGSVTERLCIYTGSAQPVNSGRHKAIAHAIEQAEEAVRHVCRYCGDKVDKFNGCPEHADIVRGRFLDDVEILCHPGHQYDYLDQNEIRDAIIEVFNDLEQGRDVYSKQAVELMRSHIEWLASMPPETITPQALQERKDQLDARLADDCMSEHARIKAEEEAALGDLRPIPATEMKVFSSKDLESLKEKATHDRKKLIEHYAKKVSVYGETRILAPIPPDWREQMDALAADFPNFAAAGVVDFICRQFALYAVADGRMYFSPILLSGPPGIGKTFFAKRVSEIASTSYLEVHMEGEQNNSTLAGSSSFWSNTQPGRLADTLLLGKYANPVVVVDELDKASQGNVYNPLSALYALLEPGTSSRFEDQCLQIPMDCSAICWVMTANDPTLIPEPIRSRSIEFEVRAPAKEQVRQIASNIYTSILTNKHLSDKFEPHLPVEITERLEAMEPRAIRNMLEFALGTAALAQRRVLEAADFEHPEKRNRMRIGF